MTDKIIIGIEESSQNEIQLKTAEILSQLEIEQFKLNRFQRLTYPFSKTGTFWLPNNSSDQLRIRYALEVRSRLSILDQGKD
ncbi:hypothetical protein [Roseivirga misakiensis]|uniref:Uncharacterized protein n=1 Tax=Roseivirga misakiensis TaxID=1563681 RepID=A0A1E5SZ21_9BACT|nr:hypothetical protein [Roseivirga misakiensis]OEK04360.1 hypothetical protein BFP71_12825 [Roseivirga misakiensis]